MLCTAIIYELRIMSQERSDGMPEDNFFPFSDNLSITVNGLSSPLYYYFELQSLVGNSSQFPHFHTFYEVLILLEGEKSYQSHIIDGEYYPFCKYDMVLLPPLLLHYTEYPKWYTHRRLMVNFSIPESEPAQHALTLPLKSLFEAKIPIYRLPEEGRNRLFRILHEIFTIKMRNHPLTDLMVHIKFLEFLGGLYDLREQNLYTVEQHSDYSIQKIYNLTRYIHTNFSQSLSLEDLSQMINISSYHLSHLFRKVTGFTLSNYIQRTRIRHTQQLLLLTNMKVSLISEQCGFTSFSQFNRIFRKLCLCSPSAFRKKYRENESYANTALLDFPA